MGRVTAEVLVENVEDLIDVRRGSIKLENIRSANILDALVDTGATSFGMPRSTIDALGLPKITEKRATTMAGPVTISIFGPARITIHGRFMSIDVMEIPEGTPALVGQISLDMLDFVVDPHKQQLIGNPAHGGEQMLELY